mmetsp:Transcript_7095/g.20109  ORF Transcript_7095/g.20109 Transcript_7095/m.20109 type:complete len:115 (-) Transcript_7095:13-357(-)
MHSYYKSSIAGAAGVQADARDAGFDPARGLEKAFQTYMVSPFKAIESNGWSFAYGREIGITSSFGHLVDHMATSRGLVVESAEVKYLTNQKLGNEEHTDLAITDHNAVVVSFLI